MIKINNSIEKTNILSSLINNLDDNINYRKILNLDIYNNIVNNKLLLYEPLEYAGFLLFLDFDYQNLNIINVLLDCTYYSFIELFKYQRETDDKYYISENILNIIPENHLKYLTNYIKIDTEINIKYDIIIITDFYKINKYVDKLTIDGIIIYIGDIKDIENNISIFEKMKLLSPIILKLSGEFIAIYNNKKKYKTNAYDFFKKHLKLIYLHLKKKKFIYNIGNIDVQKKIISAHNNKINTQILNLMNTYNIPLKTNIINYYNNKLLTITNKLYSSINVLSYQFINYENILCEIDNIKITYVNLHNISKNLNKIKRAIDTRYIKKWYSITFQLDNYKSLGEYISKKYDVFLDKKINVSNAFLKIYEILCTYDLFDIFKPNLKSFHFCEAPGMFLLGINHFIKTKTKIKLWDWYANSLQQDNDNKALGDNYNLIKKYSKRWINGDIRKLKNIKLFKDKLNEVEFITSDCGICVDYSDMNKYEEIIAETDFAQFINMINLLCKNGSGIIKTFIPLEKASNISIIYLATQLFKKVFLSKPITSRPHNSEVYLICIGFQGIDDILLEKLFNILNNFNSNISFIKDIPISFIKQLEDYILDITRQQISYLLNIFHFVDNKQELEKLSLLKNNNLKDSSNIYWCDKFNIISNTNDNDKLI